MVISADWIQAITLLLVILILVLTIIKAVR